MNKTIPLAIIGGIIVVVSIVVSFLASNVQNNIIPDHFLEVRRGDYFAVTLPFTNNNATMVEAMDVNTSLIVTAELSLVKYEFGEPSKQEGNLTMIGTGRVKNSTYTIEYKDLTGMKELKGDDISGVSFDAKRGSDVKYEFSNKIVMLEGEGVEFKYTFNTAAAQSGTYDIRAVINDNPILYRVKITP